LSIFGVQGVDKGFFNVVVEVADLMIDLEDTMVDVSDVMADVEDTMVDVSDVMADVEDTMVEGWLEMLVVGSVPGTHWPVMTKSRGWLGTRRLRSGIGSYRQYPPFSIIDRSAPFHIPTMSPSWGSL
jgi:hypothetical protein